MAYIQIFLLYFVVMFYTIKSMLLCVLALKIVCIGHVRIIMWTGELKVIVSKMLCTQMIYSLKIPFYCSFA